MKIMIGNSAIVLLAVGALAYAAGHFHVLSTGERGAWAQAKEPAAAAPPNPMMEAYTKAGTPGSNHRSLEPMAGEWIAEWKVYMQPDQPPMVSQGTLKREWILDGRYLHETVDATGPMGTFRGVGYSGYNNQDGQYEFVWMDSMSTGIYFETGTYNPQTRTLTTRGNHRDPLTGHVINGWGKMDMSNPDRHTFIGYSTDAEGKEYKSIEGIATRKR